jgi:hypothetical protein
MTAPAETTFVCRALSLSAFLMLCACSHQPPPPETPYLSEGEKYLNTIPEEMRVSHPLPLLKILSDKGIGRENFFAEGWTLEFATFPFPKEDVFQGQIRVRLAFKSLELAFEDKNLAAVNIEKEEMRMIKGIDDINRIPKVPIKQENQVRWFFQTFFDADKLAILVQKRDTWTFNVPGSPLDISHEGDSFIIKRNIYFIVRDPLIYGGHGGLFSVREKLTASGNYTLLEAKKLRKIFFYFKPVSHNYYFHTRDNAFSGPVVMGYRKKSYMSDTRPLEEILWEVLPSEKTSNTNTN